MHLTSYFADDDDVNDDFFQFSDTETGRGRIENNHSWRDCQSYGSGCSETTGRMCLVHIPVSGTSMLNWFCF